MYKKCFLEDGVLIPDKEHIMLIEERLEEILKIVNNRGSITAKKACTVLNVSNDTIRRDFIRLANMGLVQRTHGGIISKKNAIYEYAARASDRALNNREKKVSIAQEAIQLINEGDTIILDGGTTAFEMAKLLGGFRNLTVLTYGLNCAYELTQHENISTIIFGGIVSNQSMAALGPDAVNMIRHYHADKLFLAANAMTIVKGLMTPNRMQADIKKELIKIANDVIVIADSSKINKTALFAFCSFEDISTLVTDENADEHFRHELEQKGIRVIISS
jgi:DeoR/GlpR family transcriptional regulator of sugar metabolism